MHEQNLRFLIPGVMSSELPAEAFEPLNIPADKRDILQRREELASQLAEQPGNDADWYRLAMDSSKFLITANPKAYEFINLNILAERDEMHVVPISVHYGADQNAFWSQFAEAVNLPDRHKLGGEELQAEIYDWLEAKGANTHIALVFHPAEVAPEAEDFISEGRRQEFRSYIEYSRSMLEAWSAEVEAGRLGSISVLSQAPRLMFGEEFELNYDHPDHIGPINRAELEARPLHEELYNPLLVSVGTKLQLKGEEEIEGLGFIVQSVEQNEVGAGEGEVDRFTDYHLIAQGRFPGHERADEEGEIHMMLRVVQPESSSEEPFVMLMQDEFRGRPNELLIQAVQAEERDGITLYNYDGEALGEYRRSREENHAHQATRIAAEYEEFDANSKEAYLLTPGTYYWRFSREVPGEDYTEHAMVEIEPLTEVATIYVGYEIDLKDVTVL